MKKEVISSILAATMLIAISAATVSASNTQPGGVVRWYGDVNLNSSITIEDATAIQQYIAGKRTLSSTAWKNADVNKDGKVNIQDATCIQLYLAGKTHNSFTGKTWIQY